MDLVDLKRGQHGIITDVSSPYIPLKLLEMGCLPGNEVELIQEAPFSDPIYFKINDSHLAIRRDTACHIQIDITNE